MITDYILVLEDNVLVAMEIEDELTERGFRVAVAVDIAEAEALVAQEMPRAALLDLRLPDGHSAPLALHLVAQDCTVALISGADSGMIPASLAGVPRFPKPVGVWELADWATGVFDPQK